VDPTSLVKAGVKFGVSDTIGNHVSHWGVSGTYFEACSCEAIHAAFPGTISPGTK